MSSGSRKRAAPGAAPVVPIQQQRMQQQQYTGDNGENSLARWNGAGDGTGFIDDGTFGASAFPFMPNQQYPQAVATPSNALVPANQRSAFDTTDAWSTFVGDGALIQQPVGEQPVEQDSIEKLEELAQKAKRDAQGKRKQIPPFVQKLSR